MVPRGSTAWGMATSLVKMPLRHLNQGPCHHLSGYSLLWGVRVAGLRTSELIFGTRKNRRPGAWVSGGPQPRWLLGWPLASSPLGSFPTHKSVPIAPWICNPSILQEVAWETGGRPTSNILPYRLYAISWPSSKVAIHLKLSPSLRWSVAWFLGTGEQGKSGVCFSRGFPTWFAEGVQVVRGLAPRNR